MTRADENSMYSTGQLLNFESDSYLERTSRPVYAIMFLLPFIVFYEVGTILINTDVLNQSQVRVVAFVWLQEFLGYLGYNGKLAWIAPPLVVILILLGLQLASRKRWSFAWSDVWPMGPMWVECILLAIPLIVLSLFVNNPDALGPADQGASLSCSSLMPLQSGNVPHTGTLLASMVTGVGAGIYEELIFRLILICALMLFFQDLLGVEHRVSVILSILISAGLFSAHHHYVFLEGQFTLSPDNQFTWTAFGFRATAGVYFAGLFAVRGFGIAVGTHVFYDIMATTLNALFFHP